MGAIWALAPISRGDEAINKFLEALRHVVAYPRSVGPRSLCTPQMSANSGPATRVTLSGGLTIAMVMSIELEEEIIV